MYILWSILVIKLISKTYNVWKFKAVLCQIIAVYCFGVSSFVSYSNYSNCEAEPTKLSNLDINNVEMY